MAGFALHLLRHGAPDTPGLMLGRTDAVPTAEGIAGCLAQTAALRVEAVACSDLLRASRPAELIAISKDVRRTVDPRWRELDFGAWDGLAAAAIEQEALTRFWQDPDANPPPGGESWSALNARVRTALSELAPVPSLVVTHAGAMRAALSVLCGFSLHQAWSIDLRYGALLSLRVWPGETLSAQMTGLRA